MTLLQVAGSATRIALDAVPFREVDSSLVQLSTLSIGEGSMNINDTLQDIPTISTLTPAVGVPSRAPPGFWYCFVNLSIHAGLLCLSYVLFKLAITQISLLSESDTDCPPATDQRHNSANPPEHEQLTNIALALLHEPEHYYNPLSFFPSSSPQCLALFSPPPPAFIPPAISLVSHLGDAELTCAFGVPRPFYTNETAEETTDIEYDTYLIGRMVQR